MTVRDAGQQAPPTGPAYDVRAYAKALVADWPPFTQQQQDQLYVLLAPMREQLAQRTELAGAA